MRTAQFSTAIILLGLSFTSVVEAKTVYYDLTIAPKEVNLSGKESVDWAIAVNGQIPSPTLEFTEGDEAEVVVHNAMPAEEVSIHWHGLLLPNEMDGVPYLTTPPIRSGQSHTFRFKIRQHGTYWYHSHTSLQEQKGVYGAFVIHPKTKTIAYDRDLTLVLSDWSDENANQILNNMRKDGDYYQYKKNSVRSLWGALKAHELGTFFANEWSRMEGMDLSDVGYDAFLINGQKSFEVSDLKPGTKIRIRIINAAASTYFNISLGQEDMKVISADGVDIETATSRQILMGMAETYDVLYTVPEGKKVELRATAQDGTGMASAWIGKGESVAAVDQPPVDLYAPMSHGMSHGGSASEPGTHHSDHMSHHGHSKGPIETLTVDHIGAKQPTGFSKPAQTDLKLVLDGSMDRYVWHINGKAIYQATPIDVKEGDVIRFTFENKTMMHHPMHLHGHFFRVLNGKGDRSPLKHTVDVPPHGSRTIEFLANEPGRWMLHCHNLYHMKTGMAQVVNYVSYQPSTEILNWQKHDPHKHQHVYGTGELELATNWASGHYKWMRTWDELETHLETRDFDSSDGIEGEALYRRWQTNYLAIEGGVQHFGEYEKETTRGVIGVSYLLPLLIESRVFIDHRGKFQLELSKHFQWTRKLISEFQWNVREEARPEIKGTLFYASNWNWSGGITATEDSVGFGGRYRF